MSGGLRATYDIKGFLHCRIFDPVLHVLVDLWSSTRLIYKLQIFYFPISISVENQTGVHNAFISLLRNLTL